MSPMGTFELPVKLENRTDISHLKTPGQGTRPKSLAENSRFLRGSLGIFKVGRELKARGVAVRLGDNPAAIARLG